MLKALRIIIIGAVCCTAASALAQYELGREPSAAEIAAWDIDVRPDGTGLPPGSGTVAAGEALYQQRCASCHGVEGREGPFDVLVGRQPDDAFPFAEDPSAKKTIGSYWPYATTLFDYILRAMPLDAPGSLSADEVYGLSAYLLYLNDIVPADTQLGQDNLAGVEMPARGRFVVDDRRGGEEVR